MDSSSEAVQTVAVDDISFTIGSENPFDYGDSRGEWKREDHNGAAAAGRLEPTSGEVFYKGKDFADMSRQERRTFRREVQPIFQDPFESYNPFYRIDHVLNAPIRNFMRGTPRSERQRMIEEALEMVGLRPAETLGRFPHQLSGGQRQRVMVARALLLKPRIILADEPVSMVDASLRATILDSLNKLNQEQASPSST